MKTDVLKEIRALQAMKVAELRERYLEAFGEPTRSYNRDFLLKRIAWRIQANAEWDLSERARRRAEELADDADLRLRAPACDTDREDTAPRPVRQRVFPRGNGHLEPGTVLTREYHGDELQVMVREDGFEYEGEIFRSLTAVAKAITGAHWNGNHFFGITRKGG